MEKANYFDQLMISGEFRFDKLVFEDIDNAAVAKVHKKSHRHAILEQEICLFHRDVSYGEDYLEIMHNFVLEGLSGRREAPVVRFADGEFAFYANSLHCNGLYQQAESVEAIKKVMPIHMKALRNLDKAGKLAPLIHPGNVQHGERSFFSFLKKSRIDDSAGKFINTLLQNEIKLAKDNYLPFYVVYAYLTSRRFFEVMDGKRLCIISSECNRDRCRQWFATFSSRPIIEFAKIPDSYVATQWESIKQEVLYKIAPDTDLCLVGAGIGSLLICVDIAHEFSIPTIDAGHVLNMMSGLEEKSGGPRLYTIRKSA